MLCSVTVLDFAARTVDRGVEIDTLEPVYEYHQGVRNSTQGVELPAS